MSSFQRRSLELIEEHPFDLNRKGRPKGQGKVKKGRSKTIKRCMCVKMVNL